MALSASLSHSLIAALIAGTACLSGCNEGEKRSDTSAQNQTEDSCGSSQFVQLLGQKKDQLATLALNQPSRILGPNSIMTMDYRADRLNIYLDRAGMIKEISCG